MRSTRLSLSILLLVCLGWVFAGSASAEQPREPFFPGAGSRTYDASSYDVRLAYRGDGSIRASTALRAVATRRLTEFSLDFFGPRVSAVRVNGQPAKFSRDRGKLRVHAARAVPKGAVLAATISYAGTPPKVTDPDGSQEGWYRTDDGALAVGEPQGTAAWIPCNNVPTDKAEFRFEVSVPAGLKAVANGRLRGVERRGRRVTYRWEEPAPMSTYLAVLDIGRGELVEGGAGGKPAWTLVDPRLAKRSRLVLAGLPEVIDFEAGLFGGYPFDSAGSIVDYAPALGYALESQSRPIYAFAPDLTTLVHETAHQWFGDAVGVETWPQIWLNEGFATWTEWYYAEHHGGRSAHAIFKRLLRVPASKEGFWNPPSGRPASARQLFDSSIYIRGAMALQALREKIGTKPMLRLLRRWVAEHRYGNGTTAEFTLLAERVSLQDLGRFFQRWLYQQGKP
ncbi:MAG TPA: M1 family metallopeptidase [Solirubrobacterales bacterium]|nr:M1 family metallopeptidase [Solirubrobacterales bacterium]